VSGAQHRPFVIAVEGLDGTGKTTQTDLLAGTLRSEGRTVDVRSFPVYDSFFGTHVGRLLRDHDREVDPRSTALWFALDRVDEFRHRPPSGDVLLLNRFTLSNAVYQSARCDRAESDDVFAFVMELEQQRLGLPVPDLTIFLDLPEDESIRRAATRAEGRNEGTDVYERDHALQQRVRNGYLAAIQRTPGGHVIDCAHPTGLRSPIDVHADVIAIVNRVVPARRFS
jgi:dTMP kinase